MTAFLVAKVAVKDPGKFQAYAEAAGKTIAEHGGQLVQRGGFARALAGEADARNVAVMQFPSMDVVNAWFDSHEYQAIIPLRDEACDMDLTAYQAPPA